MNVVEIVEIKEGWAVSVDGEIVQTWKGDAGYLSAEVYRDLFFPEPVPVIAYIPASREPEPVEEPAKVEELEAKPPKQRDESYPFPPGIKCFWWPKNPGATMTGSYDGIYNPNNGDNPKVVIRRDENHGYLVAHTRALKHALQDAGARPGDIILITENGKGLLMPDDRGPAQLFSVEIIKKCEDRHDTYIPGKN